jgi:putative two-component system response regulator
MGDERQTILIVDDEPININVLMECLKSDYRLLAARDGEQALKRATGTPAPDLVLLDVMMPEMDGHEVCRRLKANPATANIPVIFVTAMSGDDDEAAGLALGAVDYLTKPVVLPIVQARVRTHLALRRAREELADQNRILEERVVERTRELAQTQDVTILAMATLAETRDNETGNHIRRTLAYVRELALVLRERKPQLAEQLNDGVIDLLYKSAPLHDIGKVGIPDRILLKPGPLDADEFAIMKHHPRYGRDAILAAEAHLGDGQTSFLRFAREIAYTHHEKWDGSGYPEGLAGEEIPLSGRLMAIADVYDALISRRVYKPAYPHEKAVAMILEGRGLHFDPELVDLFGEIEGSFATIAARFSD